MKKYNTQSMATILKRILSEGNFILFFIGYAVLFHVFPHLKAWAIIIYGAILLYMSSKSTSKIYSLLLDQSVSDHKDRLDIRLKFETDIAHLRKQIRELKKKDK